jgi:hypothetical protein
MEWISSMDIKISLNFRKKSLYDVARRFKKHGGVVWFDCFLRLEG